MKSIEEIFKALADRNRMRIVSALLYTKELCACQIHEWLGVSGATASKHLSILGTAGFILSRKDGRWVHYRLSRKEAHVRSLLLWVKKQISTDAKLLKDLNELKLVTDCSPAELRKRQRCENQKSTCC